MSSSPFDHVADLGRWVREAGIARLELEGPDGRLMLSHSGAAARGPTTRHEEPGPGRTLTVHAPGMGFLLLVHPLAEEPLVELGDAVEAGQALALLQAGPLLVPVLAPAPGTIERVLGTQGALTGFGDALFEIEPFAETDLKS